MSDGRTPNRLVNETSPYLQQHAYNPVDWYPWGKEALDKAKELDRPIFLSVGYSACHWCHVMEKETFEDEAIAELMNESFINVKVDREERPDIDSIYMNAVHMLTGSGGWPMSVFLTPDLRPFWGGTYFPPEQRFGRPGFRQIIEQLTKHYLENRDNVDEAAAAITEQLRRSEEHDPESELPSSTVIETAVTQADRTFDPAYGGFGPAPKFPRSVELSLLLRWHQAKDDRNALLQCEKTLECMALGGMYDQIGGGFHRYSTDREWLVPHFEKMLYDNALLTRTYLEAFQVTKKDLYRRIAREVLEYVLREMTDSEGGFYAATDADSEGEEGKFFVWTPEQVTEVLGEEKGRVLCEFYGITVGGNFEHQASIPTVKKGVADTASRLGMDAAEFERTVGEGRKALYDARSERVPPFRDEKIITAWNGLMISAFARGYQVLGDERYLKAAKKAVRFVFDNLHENGRLHRTYKDQRAQHAGYLDDYAYLCEALIDLYEASFEIDYLRRARELNDLVLASFLDETGGGFFYTADDHEELICRQKQYVDNATPAGNGVAALNLLRLERLTGNLPYRERAEEAIRSAKRYLEKIPAACSYTLIAFDFLVHPPVEIALAGDCGRQNLLQVVHESFLPRKVVAGASDAVAPGEVPLLDGKDSLDGKGTAYVCRDFACREPVCDAAKLREQLRRFG